MIIIHARLGTMLLRKSIGYKSLHSFAHRQYSLRIAG